MRIAIITTVRLGESEEAKLYLKELEVVGHKVYYPPRDTNQSDDTGYRICLENKAAIARADEVHIFYDARSQGIHFDLGMAFALGKPVQLVQILQAESEDYPNQKGGKSYLKMIAEWESK